MSTVVKSYEVHISSSQRSSGDSDYFSINFKKPIHLTDEKNTFRVRESFLPKYHIHLLNYLTMSLRVIIL